MKKTLFLITLIFSQLALTQNFKQMKETIHQFELTDLSGEKFDMSSLKGKKVMIVNTASKCGLTYQYEILEKLYNDKVILDHGLLVAQELAHVLSGGDTTIDKILSEDDLYKLELDAFMRLIETQKTQDRIKHTLATGKPLIN